MRSLITFVAVTFMLGFAFVLCASAGQSRAQAAAPVSVSCPVDGGGSIAAGDAARTGTGVWECTEDGTLIELSASVRHARPSVHASLPSWVHWAPASSRAARQVCGRGVQAITVWGGSGDTSAVVCGDGKADVS